MVNLLTKQAPLDPLLEMRNSASAPVPQKEGQRTKKFRDVHFAESADSTLTILPEANPPRELLLTFSWW
jgi:hypothetical protein